MSPLPISVVIITKNESMIIEKCLRSLRNSFDEVLVLDSGSEDDTVNIAREFATVIETDWPGYAAQKNRAASMARNKWVFSLDADEVVSEKLLNILGTIEFDNTNVSAYCIEEKIVFLSKLMPAYGRRYPILLFNRDFCQFDNVVVHEKIITKGKVKKLDGYIEHYSVDGLKNYIDKLNNYAKLWAAERKHVEKNINIPRAAASALIIFIKFYFVQRAILKGWRGFIFSIIHTQYTFNKYMYLYEIKRNLK